MNINISMHMNLLNTPVPNFFIENYMICDRPVYSLIYIFIYKECLYGKENLNLADIAQKFNIIDSDVIKCLDYWQEKNLIKYSRIETDLFMEFLFPNEDKDKDKNKNKIVKKNVFTMPSYTPEELAFWNKNESIADLFEFAKVILQRLLNYSDLNVLFAMYNDLKLPFDVIKILLEYCVSNGHNDINYIEKAAINWAENKIFDVTTAMEKVNFLYDNDNDDDNNNKNNDLADMNNNKHEKLFSDVRTCLVIRNLNPAQKKMILSWYNSGVSEELIIEACNVVMFNIGIPNFKYIDKIIKSWKRNNIKTVDEVRKLDSENLNFDFKPKKVASKSKFVNFEQREWDFDELKKITCDTED